MVNDEKTKELLRFLGDNIRGPGRLYLTGGATAVIVGWRDRTVDVDCKFDPEPKGIFEAIKLAKELLSVNIELASPDHFIPEIPGWADRSKYIGKFGMLEVFHCDFYAKALAKIERGHDRDLQDVREMIKNNLILPDELSKKFTLILDSLIRYPAINSSAFQAKLQVFLRSLP